MEKAETNQRFQRADVFQFVSTQVQMRQIRQFLR